MTKNKKHQQPKENMPNIKDKEVKQIKELKLKYLSLKEAKMAIIICLQLLMKNL